MEHEIRTIAQEELEAFRRCQAYAFGNEFNPEHLEVGRPLFEFDRNLAALDGGLIVGTAGVFNFQMTVPGERSIPTAGVTMVSVRPTHRRRGIITGVMRRQLEQVRERGESVAILWASESSIYGRFGYGMASQMDIVRIPRVWANLRNDLPVPPGIVRTLSIDEARESLPAIHERLRMLVPCSIGRWDKWWDIRIFRDSPDWRDGHTSNFYVVYEEEGVAKGFVRYRRKGDFQDWLAKGQMSVAEFYAATPEARVALWSHVFGMDLVETFSGEYGGMDAPLPFLLKDPRRISRNRIDAIWLRVVDVEKALSSRAYGAEGRLRFEVRDPFLSGAGGRFELDALPEGGVCRRSSAEPDLVVGPEELGNLYLGGGSAGALWSAGRIRGGERAVALADRLFGWHVKPHCQEGF